MESTTTMAKLKLAAQPVPLKPSKDVGVSLKFLLFQFAINVNCKSRKIGKSEGGFLETIIAPKIVYFQRTLSIISE